MRDDQLAAETETIRALVDVAAGRNPADLVLVHARIVNVSTGKIETGIVAIHAGRIAGIEDYRLIFPDHN